MVFTTDEEEILKLFIADIKAKMQVVAVGEADNLKNKPLRDAQAAATTALKNKCKE